jgi:hypothetical protein
MSGKVSVDWNQVSRYIFKQASHRWLHPEEIYLLLIKPKELGVNISENVMPKDVPESTEIFLQEINNKSQFSFSFRRASSWIEREKRKK